MLHSLSSTINFLDLMDTSDPEIVWGATFKMFILLQCWYVFSKLLGIGSMYIIWY